MDKAQCSLYQIQNSAILALLTHSKKWTNPLLGVSGVVSPSARQTSVHFSTHAWGVSLYGPAALSEVFQALRGCNFCSGWPLPASLGDLAGVTLSAQIIVDFPNTSLEPQSQAWDHVDHCHSVSPLALVSWYYWFSGPSFVALNRWWRDGDVPGDFLLLYALINFPFNFVTCLYIYDADGSVSATHVLTLFSRSPGCGKML